MDALADSQAPAPPDSTLLGRARAGDFAAFEALLARYQDRLQGSVWRMLRHPQDTQDVVQQTLISAIEHLDDLRDDAHFGAWLMRIGSNHALHLMRHRRRHPEVPLTPDGQGDDGLAEPLPHPDFIAPWRESPAQLLARRDLRAQVERVLLELDDKYRMVFILRDLNEFSTDETARLLQLTPGTVKVRLLRARLQLRERLTRLLGDPTQRLEHPRHEHA